MGNGRVRMNILLLPMNGKCVEATSDSSAVIALTDPERAIGDVNVHLQYTGSMNISNLTTDNVALGILDYLNDGQQGMLQENARDPYTAFLLMFYQARGWKKMWTHNIVKVYALRTIKQALTAIHLDHQSPKQ
jgi:hypothetical protein